MYEKYKQFSLKHKSTGRQILSATYIEKYY